MCIYIYIYTYTYIYTLYVSMSVGFNTCLMRRLMAVVWFLAWDEERTLHLRAAAVAHT